MDASPRLAFVDLSIATALIVWLPAEVFLVLHLYTQEVAPLVHVLTVLPSIWILMLAIPESSEAEALTVMVPEI